MFYRMFKTFLLSSSFAFGVIPLAHSYIPTQTNSPLDNQNSAEIEGAYSILFEKTDAEHAMFASYEQDENKNWQKVYYTYGVSSTSGKDFTSTYNRYNSGNGEQDIVEHFMMNKTTPINVNGPSNCTGQIACGGAIYLSAPTQKLGNIYGDFIQNTAEGALGYGGAIYNKGSIGNITGGFIENSSVNYGGAIYNSGTMKDIISEFFGNRSTTGGAIYNDSGIIDKIYANFISNKASAVGGAIYNKATINSIDGNFIGNTAKSNGGAISNTATGIIGTIKGYFIGNKVTDYNGGAIVNNGTIGKIEGGFIGNETNHNGTILNEGKITSISAEFAKNKASRGAAIYNNIGFEIDEIEGEFTENHAVGYGGAIYNSGKIKNILANFTKNIAETYSGGAIYNDANGVIDQIQGSFTDNFAINSGGAIYNSGEMKEISGSFSNNIADYQGGAIYNNAKIGTITGEFNDNHATKYSGGAIYNYSEITNILANFSNNTAVSYGAGIYNFGIIGNISGQFIANVTEKNGGAAILNDNIINNISGKFSKNVAATYGAAIYNAEKGKINSINGEFVENIAGLSGGAIYNLKAEIGDIEGIFTNNKSTTGWGGAIYSDGKIGTIIGEFIGNRAETYSGGAIYNDGNGIIDKIQGTFKENFALSYGGAIYNNTASTITSIQGAFENNISNSQGGAIFNNGAIENIEGEFTNNIVTKYNGGAIYNAGEIKKITAIFEGNKAVTYGGAIYNNNKIGEIYADFNNNIAENNSGGAIYNADKGKITNIRGAFSENESGLSGGAIYNIKAEIETIEGNFINNKSKAGWGGAIYTDGKIGTIVGEFIGNKSEKYSGGAIYNNSNSTIGSIQGTFKDNYALSYGGAIYNNSSSTITSIHGLFDGNISNNQGGAIYNNGLIESLKGEFVKNIVTKYSGGAIFNNDEIKKIEASFEENRALTHGGAIYNNKKIGEIYANFKNNVAENNSAGAFYNNGEIKNIVGNFTGNAATTYGGAIFNNTGLVIENITGDFLRNTAKLNEGGAIYNKGTITLSTSADKRSILFEDNRDVNGLNAIHMVGSATLNLNMVEKSYINIKDTISSDVSSNVINKTGAGSLYLWGDNRGYNGALNIKEGSFYAMFDEKDKELQRQTFSLENTQVTFSNGTIFRPMMNGAKNKLAELNLSKTSIPLGGGVAIVPYAISSLHIGDYSFKNNYYGFEGWESELAKVDISGKNSVDLVIKRDLVGYKGLSALADVYRKRSDLSLAEREVFDNIYYTGEVSKDVKEQFKVIEGQDKIAYATVHKAGVRQFSRQISSRLQNKNCPSCGMQNGYADEHLWFNIGQNFVEKDTKGSSLGYKYNPTSLAIGYDHDIIPNALNVGVAFSYAYGEIKGKGENVQNSSDLNEYMLSLYWKYKPNRAYVTGSLGGGLIKSKTKLVGSTIDVRGRYDTKAAFSNFEFGYDFGNACGTIEPFVGIEYAYIYSDAYTEKGVGARHFDSNGFNSIELPIGFRVSRNVMVDSYIITPAVELAYARSLGDVNSKIDTYFVGNPSSPWVLKGTDESKDSLRGSLNMKINNLDSPIAFNFGYARDTRSNYSDDQFYLTVRYNF